jgi:DNA-binding PadR family transcriptional regulator
MRRENVMRSGHRPLLSRVPELTAFGAVVLHYVRVLGPDASGMHIIDRLNTETFAKHIDQAQVYVALNRMAKRELLEVAQTRQFAGSPPMKIWQLTHKGGAALDDYVIFNDALLAMLKGPTTTRATRVTTTSRR